MKIEVITTYYNDSFLIPFFLNHYSYADHVRVLVDADTEDKPEGLIREHPNASWEYFTPPNGYDVNFRQETIFKACNESRADWILAPDTDEFIFCNDMHRFLDFQTADIVMVRLYQAFRNMKDIDLDPSLPIEGQRKYGDPNYVKGKNSHGTKPIVFRTGKRIHLMPGNHNVWNMYKYTVSKDILTGQHWQMADPSFCVERRLSRKKRLSQANLPNGYAYHDLTVTPEFILSECNAHLNDGELPL